MFFSFFVGINYFKVVTFNLYRLYQNNYKELISLFERLSFKDKKNILIELFLILEYDELLPDNIDGHEIARIILKY